jgi:serine/threonine-protein kinase
VSAWTPAEQLAAEYERYYQAYAPASPGPFLHEHADWNPAAQRAVLRTDLRLRLLAGQPVRVEAYFHEFPQLSSEESARRELIVEEFRARRLAGSSVSPAELRQRFPQWAEELSAWCGLGDEAERSLPAGTALPASDLGSGGAGSHESTLPYPVHPSGSGYAQRRAQRAKDDPLGVKWLVLQQRYEVTRYIGRGALGCVYEGRDLKFGRTDDDSNRVAIKFMRDERRNQEGFQREARLMKQFRHHRMVQVYDYGVEEDGLAWLAMEFVPGRSLAAFLKDRGRLPLPLFERLVDELAPALHAAHMRRMVHRDLKPLNVMVTTETGPHDFHFKILDFGLSAHLDAKDSLANQTSDSLGTPAYMAPEQVQGHKPTPQTDIYSFGAMLFEVLTGALPIPVASAPSLHRMMQMVIGLEPLPFAEVAPDEAFPPGLEQVIRQCLAKDPRRRPQSMLDVHQAIRRVLRPQPSPVAVRAQRAATWAAVAVAAISMGLGLFLALRPPSNANGGVTTPAVVPLPPLEFDVEPPSLRLFAGLPGQTVALRPRGAAPGELPHVDHIEAPPGIIVGAAPSDETAIRFTVSAADAAEPAAQQVKFSVNSRRAVAAVLNVQVVWLPRHWSPVDDAPVVSADGRWYCERLQRTVAGERLILRLIPDLKGCLPLKAFYFGETRLSRNVAADFVNETGLAADNAAATELVQRWNREARPRWPATGFTAEIAQRCAVWLGGELPSPQQWDRAAGAEFHRAAETGCLPPAVWDANVWPRGPFREPWSPTQHSAVALAEFVDVGAATHDVSCFGCRDMAGNGTEFTNAVRDGTSTGKRVPVAAADVSEALFVELRGKAIGSAQPWMFQESSGVHPYTEPAAETGFRLVINP